MTSKPTTHFRGYNALDLDTCLALFDANCPQFFAPNERDEYEQFLGREPAGYEIGLIEHQIVGAYGLSADEPGIGNLSWILVDPRTQGLGVGSAMMHRAVHLARRSSLTQVNIAASHLSESFFMGFGATTVARTENGWGAGMHRHDMTLRL